MANLILSIILLATLNVSCTIKNVTGNSDELDALLKWKSTLRSQNSSTPLPSWKDVRNSNASAAQKTVSPCNWYGVACNENGSVKRLKLSSAGLNGTLDHLSFSAFQNLEYFELSLNNLYGIIPSEIAQLSNLVFLDLAANRFTGIIPPEIGKLKNLVTLHLFKNQLEGSIPETICEMGLLSDLGLNENNLVGSVPACFGLLSNLTQVFLNRNNISGSIPHELGNIHRLTTKKMSFNDTQKVP